MFGFSEVERFKEKIQNTPLTADWSVNEAAVILKGDSFFNTGYDSDPVPNALENNWNQKIFYKPTSGREVTPLKYLAEINYQTGTGKYFILETVERNAVERARGLEFDFKNNSVSDINTLKNDYWSDIKSRVKVFITKSNIRSVLFDRVSVEYFIKNNILFRPVNIWLKNKAFNWFGDINSKTPIYLDNPNLLFFDAEINFNEDKKKLEEINYLADNIAQEARLIQEKYNLTFVYLIIPNKFSVYGDLVAGGKSYDNFIPLLQAALQKRGIQYIDVYQIFTQYKKTNPDDLLFYGGDTHYSPVGKQLVIDEIINSKIFK